MEEYQGKVLVIAYTTVGIRGDCDLMLWRISYELELFQEMSTKILASGLGKYLLNPVFVPRNHQTLHLCRQSHPRNQESKRLTVVPGQGEVHLRVSVREDSRMVPAHQGRATGHRWTNTLKSAIASPRSN